jgi:hypothetical protein
MRRDDLAVFLENGANSRRARAKFPPDGDNSASRDGSDIMASTDACTETTCDGTCECIWMCGRGPARLCCQLRRHGPNDFELEVVRNGRLYGTYRFVERPSAVTFASRLRHTFEGNGWAAA